MPEESTTSAQSDEFEALYAQTAGGMGYDNGRLTLDGIAATTLYFSDRPNRITGHVPTEEFFDSWGEGDDSFASDPPNAVLSIFSEDEVNDVVVVLQDPALKGDHCGRDRRSRSRLCGVIAWVLCQVRESPRDAPPTKRASYGLSNCNIHKIAKS